MIGRVLFYGAVIGAVLLLWPPQSAAIRVTATPVMSAPTAPSATAPAAVVDSNQFLYMAPPSIARETYIAIYTHYGSPAAGEAGAIYDFLVGAGFDPAVHAAQAMHETGLGRAGIGVVAYKNMHGVQCHTGDGRISESPVPWGNGCAGVYDSYLSAVRTWANVIEREYVAEGLTTPDTAVWKYAPPGADGNDPPAYIADMKRWIIRWRQGDL